MLMFAKYLKRIILLSAIDDIADGKKYHINLFYTCALSVKRRENLNKREGQTDSTTIEKYYLTWTIKGVQCYPKFLIIDVFYTLTYQYRGV